MAVGGSQKSAGYGWKWFDGGNRNCECIVPYMNPKLTQTLTPPHTCGFRLLTVICAEYALMYMQMTIVATKAAPSATRRPPGLRGESWKTPCRASPVEAHCRSEYLMGGGSDFCPPPHIFHMRIMASHRSGDLSIAAPTHISHLPYLLHTSCRPGRTACPPATPPGRPQGYSSNMMISATTTVAPKVRSHTPVSNGYTGDRKCGRWGG